MFLNLLATALVLCILGVVFLLVAYVTALAILLFIPWTQAYLVFAHWLRLQNPARLLTPEAYTLRPFATRTIYISTPDGLRLGAWHILPLNTSRAVLEKIHAIDTRHTRAGSTAVQEDLATDSIFEEALINAEKVVLYFHGQAGDRGKGNRISAYQGIQRSIPSAHVVTIDCRGYGDSEGFPSEAGFKVDALTAWSWITKRVEAHKVLIYGHSLGSGIATNLCLQLEEQQIQPLALVLDAAFTSMPDMMTGYRRIPIVWPFARFPVLLNHFKLRLMDRFETVRAVETMKSPLLLIHGQEDADVLITNSHTLFHTALTARRLQSCTKELAVTEAGEAGEAEDEMARAGLELSFQVSHSTGRHLESLDQAMMRRNIREASTEEGKDNERPSSFGSDSGIGSEAASGNNSAFATSPRRHGSKEEDHLSSAQLTSSSSLSTPLEDVLKEHHDHKHHHHHHHSHHIHDEHNHTHYHDHRGKEEHSQCTIQLEFPREGALEYNQEYQIGFLTVDYAVHNTCIDFEIAKEALGAFVETVEKKRRSGMATVDRLDTNKHGHEHGQHYDDLARILRRRKIGFVDQSEVPEVVE